MSKHKIHVILRLKGWVGEGSRKNLIANTRMSFKAISLKPTKKFLRLFITQSLRITMLVLILTFFSSCDKTKVYESYTDFDEGFWHQDSVVSFSFTIEDASQPYHLKAQFRNAQTYPYHNMYYRYTLKDENDSVLSEEQIQIFLFDPKTGEPSGSGLGDLFDNSQVVLENYNFPNAGNYSVDMKQFMRLDTLPSLLSVGWRVERVE